MHFRRKIKWRLDSGALGRATNLGWDGLEDGNFGETVACSKLRGKFIFITVASYGKPTRWRQKVQSNNIGAHQRLLSVKTNGKTELFYFCGVRTWVAADYRNRLAGRLIVGARYEFWVRRPGRWKFRGNCCVFQVAWQIHFHYCGQLWKADKMAAKSTKQ